MAVSAPLDQKRLRVNVFGGYLSKAATLLIALVATPVLYGYLGKERYGLWMAFAGIVALAPIGDLGVGGAIVVRLARALGADDKESAKRIVSTGFFLLVLISVAMALVSVLALPWLPWADWFHVQSPLARSEALPSVLVLFLSLSLIIPLNICINVLVANQESFRYSVWLSVGCLIQIVAAYVAVANRASLPVVIFTSAGLPAVLWIALDFYEFGFRKRWLAPRWSQVDFGLGQELASLGFKILLGQTARTALLTVDAMVIGSALGAAEVSDFSIWSRLFFMAQLSQYAVNAWGPAYAASFEKGKEDEAFTFFQRTTTKYALLSAGAAIVLALVLGPVLEVWIGSRVTLPSLGLRVAFVVWAVVWALTDSIATYSTAGRHVKFHVVLYTLAMLVVVLGKIVLVRGAGADGIIWSLAAGMGLLYVAPMGYRLWSTRQKQVPIKTEETEPIRSPGT